MKKADAATSLAAAVDTESDDLDLGRTSGTRGHGGIARGRGRETGSLIKARAVTLKQHEVRRQAPRLVATGTTGQLEVQLEDPLDRPAKLIKPTDTVCRWVLIITQYYQHCTILHQLIAVLHNITQNYSELISLP